jgi:hypothetical protein
VIKNSEELNPEEYRELLLKMYNWAKTLPDSATHRSFQSQILREVLQLDLEHNQPNKDMFLAYLENPNNQLGTFNATYKKSLQNRTTYDSFWHTSHQLKINEWLDENKLVESYLNNFFKTMTNFGEFEKYFTPEFLKKQFYMAKIQNGENIENITKIFNETELTEMREAKKLKFVTWNKNRFTLGQEITLHLEIKNIQNFCVNIFEINTESYYRKNKSEIHERINLTGLIPSKSVEYNLTTAPIISQVMEFKDLFPSKRGVFIVEFIGGGLSSRALIRIGALSLIRQVLSKGLLFHMIDETKKVCSASTTDMIVADKVFKPDPELGYGILIPYSKTELRETAILRHEGYTELYTLNVPAEKVTFDMGLIFNEETLIAGTQISFLLMPKLYINGKAVSNVAIKKLRADITSTNDVGINNTSTIEDIKLDNSNDAVITYMVPLKTERIDIKVSGSFMSSAQEKEIDIYNTKTITINRFRDKYIYYGTYISQSEGNYTLHYLGKNGEPYPNQKVSVTFTPIYINASKAITFETDAKGEVQLGNLSEVSHIGVNMLDSPCTEKLNISYAVQNLDKITTLPRTFDIVEGEDICFPPLNDQVREFSDYELIKVCKNNAGSLISDHRSQLSYEDGVIFLNKLTEGTYRFVYRPLSQIITVQVHKGQRWEASSEYLIKENAIVKLMTQSQYISYKDLNISDKSVGFKVMSNNLSSVQVHAFAFSYLPSTFPTLLQSVKNLKVDETSETFNIITNNNVFLSEKNLGDEIKYVLERKRKNTFMGNTLDKPSSLLKRHFVKETNQDQEQLKAEKDYGDSMKRASANKQNLGAVGGKSVSSISYNINNMNTFLGKEGWAQFNIHPDENGQVAFDLPESTCYGTLVFVIKDGKNSIVEIKSLKSTQKEFKDVTLPESKQANKVYLYDRIAHKVPAGESCEIKDLTATELSIVEDTQTLFKMLKLISNNSQLDEWEFLSKWNSLEPEDQIKKYDKYMCHEFNLFAYFKDKEFFNAVVKPHLANKSAKQLVDYFLLENEAELRKFLNPASMKSLNIIETALLVSFFAKAEPEKAKAIAAKMSQIVSSQYVDIKEFKRLFDSVLKAQVTTESAVLKTAIATTAAPMMQQARMTQGRAMMNRAPMMQQSLLSNIAPMRNMQARAAPRMQMQSMAMDNCETQEYNDEDDYYGGECEDIQVYDECQNEQIYMEKEYKRESKMSRALNRVVASQPTKIERYRTLGVTNEYIERHYYQGSSVSTSVCNKFWMDYLNHCVSGSTKPFLSENFIYAVENLTVMILVLALEDLPFEKKLHTTDTNANKMTLKAGSNCMVFSKEIQEKGDQKVDIDILISQRFYDPFDRYVHSSDGNTKMLKNVTEFLVGKLYLSRVAITNSSETHHEINLVTEIPQGSVPVISIEYMKSTTLSIEPLSTEVTEYFFYFPKEGEFTCYPASINKDGCLVTTATGVSTLKVVRTRQMPELKTITDILSMGNKDDILTFLDEQNLHNTDIFQFNNIYWLLDDEQFYKSVIALLKRKFIYDDTVWSFSIKHGDFENFVEYINNSYYRSNAINFNNEEVLFIDTPILKVDKFVFKEYNPLINPRVHDIGEFKHNILNRDFKATYLSFLKYLNQKTFMTSQDYTYFCTYLLLQDRIDDCLQLFPRIKAEEISQSMAMQYDYLTAYLDLYNDYPKFTKARDICSRYLTYPVFTWRNRFVDLLNQISEFDGETELLEKQTEETDTDKNQRQAKKEEYISTELNGKALKVTTKNITNFLVKFYRVDLEIMYSQDPFLSVDRNDYSYVTPNHIIDRTIEMNTEFATELVPIPENLISSNLIIQISSGGLSENLTYFPTSMKVFIVKNFGQIKVTTEDTGKPLSNVYIKCFAKKNNGTVTFYKDGYTDLRGTFEYTSVHGSDFADVNEFSLLVYSDSHGALIKQTKPPTTVAKVEVTANKIVSKKHQVIQDKMRSLAKNKYMKY